MKREGTRQASSYGGELTGLGAASSPPWPTTLPCLVTRLMLLFLLRRIVRWIHRTPADLHQMRRLGHLCQRAVNARCRVKKEIVIGARTLEALMRALRASNSAGPRKTGESNRRVVRGTRHEKL